MKNQHTPAIGFAELCKIDERKEQKTQLAFEVAICASMGALIALLVLAII